MEPEPASHTTLRSPYPVGVRAKVSRDDPFKYLQKKEEIQPRDGSDIKKYHSDGGISGHGQTQPLTRNTHLRRDTQSVPHKLPVRFSSVIALLLGSYVFASMVPNHCWAPSESAQPSTDRVLPWLTAFGQGSSMLGSPLTYLGTGGLAPPDHHPPSSPTNHLLQVFPCRSALLKPRQLLQTNKLRSLAWVVPQVYPFSYSFAIPLSLLPHAFIST